MDYLHVLAVFSSLCIICVSGLILPMTKTDGTLDVSSLMSHIALLEQTIENKASASEVENLKSELAETKTKLTQVETKLETVTGQLTAANAELVQLKSDQAVCQKAQEEMKSDLKKAEIEIAVLKNQLLAKGNGSSSPSTSTAMTDLSSDVSHLKTDVSQLTNSLSQLQSLYNKTGGSTFTRWGRTSCPVGSNIVYKGYTGGSRFDDKASAANTLCLPDQPIFANHTTTGHDVPPYYNSHVFGTEYEVRYDGGLFKNLVNEDMPCVVCESKSYTTSIMVPARNQCYPGYTPEYSGYLMGPSFNDASGEYICVDQEAEAIPGGQQPESGHLLFPVEGRCGALPCPPYHDLWELTCAVCSK